MYAIKAIYDGTNFIPMQPIPVKENYKVIITFIKPIDKDTKKLSFPYFPVDTTDYMFDREEANEAEI